MATTIHFGLFRWIVFLAAFVLLRPGRERGKVGCFTEPAVTVTADRAREDVHHQNPAL